MNAKEEWRDVVGYEGLYEVSNLGSVASKQKTVMAKNGTTRSYPRRKLKQYENSSGYMRVHLCKDGSPKTVLVHRIVTMAFVDNPSSKPFVNHLDENKQNNRADNLEWVTNDENLNYGTGRLKNAISDCARRVLCSTETADAWTNSAWTSWGFRDEAIRHQDHRQMHPACA